MEFRDRDKLTDAEEEAADASMRRLLARYDQPSTIEPPVDLAARVLARLPPVPPAAAAATERRLRRTGIIASSVAIGVFTVFVLLGLWGVFGSSSGPALMFGDVTSGIGQTVLILILAAKPLVHLMVTTGGPFVIFGLLITIGGSWLWWQFVQRAPLLQPQSLEA